MKWVLIHRFLLPVLIFVLSSSVILQAQEDVLIVDSVNGDSNAIFTLDASLHQSLSRNNPGEKVPDTTWLVSEMQGVEVC